MNRCRNCGSTDHLTQYCKEYGPEFPAPDRTKQSYDEQRREIAALVAQDIIDEHDEGWHVVRE